MEKEIKYCIPARGCGKSQKQIKELVENIEQGNKVVFVRKDMAVDSLNLVRNKNKLYIEE